MARFAAPSGLTETATDLLDLENGKPQEPEPLRGATTLCEQIPGAFRREFLRPAAVLPQHHAPQPQPQPQPPLKPVAGPSRRREIKHVRKDIKFKGKGKATSTRKSKTGGRVRSTAGPTPQQLRAQKAHREQRFPHVMVNRRPTSIVFVGNLPPGVDQEKLQGELYSLFSGTRPRTLADDGRALPVMGVVLRSAGGNVIDPGRVRLYASVEFSAPGCEHRALNLNGQHLATHPEYPLTVVLTVLDLPEAAVFVQKLEAMRNPHLAPRPRALKGEPTMIDSPSMPGPSQLRLPSNPPIANALARRNTPNKLQRQDTTIAVDGPLDMETENNVFG